MVFRRLLNGDAVLRVVMVSKALVVGAYQRKAEELAKTPDIELKVVVPDGWRDRRAPVLLDRAHTDGYELVVLPVVLNGRFHEHFYPTLGSFLARNRPDILHMDEEPYNLATWLGLRAGLRSGAQGIFFTWQNLARRYPWPYRVFERDCYRWVAHAIAGNQAAAGVLRRKGYAGALSVIPQFGVDAALLRPHRPVPGEGGSSAGTEEKQSAFMIGYAGRLVPEKGVDVLLRACAALPFREWSLAVLGDGPSKAMLVSLAAELGIAGEVRFLDQMPSTRIGDFYSTLDVLVVPSLTRSNWIEQFGRVITEAMACEVPVIGSDSGEIPNVIGDAGAVFPEGDVHALRDLLVQFHGNDSRRIELGRSGRQRVLERFTQERIAAATAEVYRSLDTGNSAIPLRGQ